MGVLRVAGLVLTDVVPRRNRPRDDDPAPDPRVRAGAHVEVRRGREYTVQPVDGRGSEKTYVCPGCTRTIPPLTPHLVVWRADGVLGEAADLAARRHWHTRCWRIA